MGDRMTCASSEIRLAQTGADWRSEGALRQSYSPPLTGEGTITTSGAALCPEAGVAQNGERKTDERSVVRICGRAAEGACGHDLGAEVRPGGRGAVHEEGWAGDGTVRVDGVMPVLRGGIPAEIIAAEIPGDAALPVLSLWEQRALALISTCADKGFRFPTCDDLADAIGCEALSSTVMVVKRLEAKGLIRVERFHRERVGVVVATGKRTAEPKSRALPWRHRPEHGCEPVALLQRQHPEAYRRVVVEARRARRSVAAYLADLIAETVMEKAGG